jgi:hypothetical protein
VTVGRFSRSRAAVVSGVMLLWPAAPQRNPHFLLRFSIICFSVTSG